MAITVPTHAELHRLVDQVPDTRLPAAARSLRRLARPPVDLDAILANAPVDDEPETPAEAAAVADARRAVADGHIVTQAEIDREFGR